MYSIKQHSKLYTVTLENCSTSVQMAVLPSHRPGYTRLEHQRSTSLLLADSRGALFVFDFKMVQRLHIILEE